MKPAYVLGLGLWTPGYANLSHWAEKQHDPEVKKPPCAILPSRQKRGTSLVTRIGAEVIEQAATQSKVDLSQTMLVFGSAYGEIQTAVDQMEMIESEDGRLSPSRFKNSVHNTVTGLLSISLKNHGFGTAIAAGDSTFAMSLLEGLALLDDQGGSVIVAVADEAPDDPFGGRELFDPLGIALCLSSESANGHKPLGGLSEFRRESRSEISEIPRDLKKNPVSSALPLVHCLMARKRDLIPLELKSETPYCIDVTF